MGRPSRVAEDDYTVTDAAAAATRMLRHRVPDAEIKDILPEPMREEAWRLARLRKKASERFEDPWDLFFDETGLRYATPDTVARARAERLAEHGDTAVDVACGVGIQLAFLAQRFDRAVGVELDPDKAALAERNLEAYGVDAEVLVADALDAAVRESVGDVDVVVCDPARAPKADERDFEGLSPDIREVHEAWGDTATATCYELPPMMGPEKVHPVLPGECEYTSLAGDLNRLAVYGGTARETDEAALALPDGERLTDDDPAGDVDRVDAPGAYLLKVDRAVLAAGLLEQLAHRADATGLLTDAHPRRTLLAAPAPAQTAFTEAYEVLATHDWNLLGLHEKLKRLDAGSVTLRTSIDPDRYWDVRNALEDGLEGDRHVHLFRVDDIGVLTQPVEG